MSSLEVELVGPCMQFPKAGWRIMVIGVGTAPLFIYLFIYLLERGWEIERASEIKRERSHPVVHFPNPSNSWS